MTTPRAKADAVVAAAAALIAAAAASWPGVTARAQTPAGPEGTYCLRGVREVGSCLRLGPDSAFEYFLAYGAYDEKSEGHWKADGADVVVDSPPYDKAPTFAFKGFQPAEGGRFDIIVVGKAGTPIFGIDVRATCGGRAIEVGVTGAEGYDVNCAEPPTEVALGLKMFGVGYQTIKVPAPTGADKAYVFEFDAGDLGFKPFAGTRLKREGADSLVMTYANPAIPELDGKTFTYERERK
jgi:hypothetical protein